MPRAQPTRPASLPKSRLSPLKSSAPAETEQPGCKARLFLFVHDSAALLLRSAVEPAEVQIGQVHLREVFENRRRVQFLRLIALLAVIALGLALRRFGYAADLPFIVVKYGGSALWGAMVLSAGGAHCRKVTASSNCCHSATHRDLSGIVPALSHALARRVSADHGRRPAAWPGLFALEHAGLCNRHSRGLRLRSGTPDCDASSPLNLTRPTPLRDCASALCPSACCVRSAGRSDRG